MREYTEAQLYNQLCYFQFMFHFEKATMGISPPTKGTLVASNQRDFEDSRNGFFFAYHYISSLDEDPGGEPRVARNLVKAERPHGADHSC